MTRIHGAVKGKPPPKQISITMPPTSLSDAKSLASALTPGRVAMVRRRPLLPQHRSILRPTAIMVFNIRIHKVHQQ